MGAFVIQPTPRKPLLPLSLDELTKFPSDLLRLFLSYLDYQSLLAVSLVNRQLLVLAEEETTALGKVKRVFRVFNSHVEVNVLSFPNQNYRITYPHNLNAKTNNEDLKIAYCHIKPGKHTVPQKESIVTIRGGSLFYTVSPTLFVFKKENNRLESHRINPDASITSSLLHFFPFITHPQEFLVEYQQENVLHLKVENDAAQVLHFLTYIINEKNGAESGYLSPVQHHVICHLDNDKNVKFIDDKGKRIWVSDGTISKLEAREFRGKWLILVSGSREDMSLRLHFLDITSKAQMVTFDILKDRNNLEENIDLTFFNRKFFLKENICVIVGRHNSRAATEIAAATVLQLEAKKSIRLSYRSMKVLNSLAPPDCVFHSTDKISWDFSKDNGFFVIEGTCGYFEGTHQNDLKRIQLRFGGNPNIPLKTSFSPKPPLSVSIFRGGKKIFQIINFAWQIIAGIAAVLLCGYGIALIIYIAFKILQYKIFSRFPKTASSRKIV